jgi:hypothetical protein
MVDLGNADNTSDVNKPVSTAQQTALDLKANLASPTFTGTVGGISKAMVGLGNADNTSDVNKPVSTAQQTALNLKANLASPTFTGIVSGISKAMVGLDNADNTSDTAKPVSTAQQTALDLKAPLASPVFTGIATVPNANISQNLTVSENVTVNGSLTLAGNNVQNQIGNVLTRTKYIMSDISDANTMLQYASHYHKGIKMDNNQTEYNQENCNDPWVSLEECNQ